MNPQNQQNRIEFLIRALNAIKEDPSLEIYADVPKDIIDIFIFDIVSTFPKYSDWKDNDEKFKEIKGWNNEKLDYKLAVLQDVLKETINGTGGVPVLDSELELAVEHEQQIVSSKQKSPDNKFITLITARVEPEKLKEDAFEQLKILTPNVPEAQLKKIVEIYVSDVSRLNSENDVPIVDIEAIKVLNPSKEINRSDIFFILNKPVSISVKTNPPAGSIWTNPTIIRWGVEELAKEGGENTVKATAVILSSQKIEDLQRMGVDRQIAELYAAEIKRIQDKGGSLDWIKKAELFNQFQFNDKQIQIINAQTSGIQSFAVFNNAFPVHQSFLGNIVNNIGKRVFGKISGNIIKKSIGAAGSQVAAGATNLLQAAGFVVSEAVPILGPIIVWLATKILGWIKDLIVAKILPWIKKHLNLLLIGGGLIGGYLAAGVIGAAAGGVLGGVAAGAISGAGTVAAIGGFFAAFFSGLLAIFITPIIITFVGIPILVVFILFIINSGAYVVPPATPLTGNPFAGRGSTGQAANFNCDGPAGQPVPGNVSVGPAIAQRAGEIANSLKQGFWADYNDASNITPNPSYPELFNRAVYTADPNPTYPGPIQNCGDCMFWCTWLVQKSYAENGDGIPLNLGAHTMACDFWGRGKSISAASATPQNIIPGSAIFFSVRGGDIDHVGVVTSVSQDNLVFVQSNGVTIGGSLTFDQSGTGIQNLGDSIQVVGFGLP